MSNHTSQQEAPRLDRRSMLGGIAVAATGAGLLAATGPARAAGEDSRTAANLATVGRIYEAFGKGDVPTVLAALDDGIAWEAGYGHNSDIPWLRSGTGIATVGAFFETLRSFTFNRFEVLTMAASGDWVIVLTAVDLTWNPTGRRIVEACEPHVWRFGADGKAISLRHASDTRQHAQALQPLPDYARS